MKDLTLKSVAILIVWTPALASAQATEASASAQATEAPAAPPEVSPDAGAEPPVGKIHLASQAAPTGNSRTYHRHDGFYLRANVGYGTSWVDFNDEGAGNADLSASGSGLALDLLLGGSPSPGLAVGGGLLGNFLFSADFETDDGDNVDDRNVSSALLGVFVDGFPQVTGGFHVGGLIGVSRLSLNKSTHPDATAGLGGAVWAGLDHWVADDWAVGGLLRFTAAQTTGETGAFDVTAAAANLTLMFSVLHH